MHINLSTACIWPVVFEKLKCTYVLDLFFILKIVRRIHGPIHSYSNTPEISLCLDLTTRTHNGFPIKPRKHIRAGW